MEARLLQQLFLAESLLQQFQARFDCGALQKMKQ
jgi:hypothetical protein